MFRDINKKYWIMVNPGLTTLDLPLGSTLMIAILLFIFICP